MAVKRAKTRFECPICGRPFDSELSPAMPFCSRRCQQIDLARWLNEEYSAPWVGRDEEPKQEGETTDE
jgi:hypothetical protein